MATPKQMRKLIELFEDIPSEQVQNIIGSGLLTDLRGANIPEIDREKFRIMCGLKKEYRRTNNEDGTISFFVKVRRYRSSKKALEATGC